MKSSRSMPASRKRSSGGFLLGMFVGLGLGLLVSLGIAFYLNRTPIPMLAQKKPTEKEAQPPAKAPAIAGMPTGAAPVLPEKPKFDFYRILPGSEEPVTDKELRERLQREKAKSPSSGQQEASKDVYFIQVGSFQNPAQADDQKARLALIGFEATVEPANLPDKGTWYRVRLGPYRKVEEINKVREALARSQFDANLVKAKEQ